MWPWHLGENSAIVQKAWWPCPILSDDDVVEIGSRILLAAAARRQKDTN